MQISQSQPDLDNSFSDHELTKEKSFRISTSETFI
jgi:hypothetical protein